MSTATLADKLASKMAKNVADDVQTYRTAVHLAAGGDDKLSGKQLDELAEAMRRLNLTEADFRADVSAVKVRDNMQRAVDTLPTEAEEKKEWQDHKQRVATLEQEIDERKKELREIGNLFPLKVKQRVDAKQSLESHLRDNPRVFGVWPTPKSEAPKRNPYYPGFGLNG